MLRATKPESGDQTRGERADDKRTRELVESPVVVERTVDVGGHRRHYDREHDRMTQHGPFEDW